MPRMGGIFLFSFHFLWRTIFLSFLWKYMHWPTAEVCRCAICYRLMDSVSCLCAANSGQILIDYMIFLTMSVWPFRLTAGKENCNRSEHCKETSPAIVAPTDYLWHLILKWHFWGIICFVWQMTPCRPVIVHQLDSLLRCAREEIHRILRFCSLTISLGYKTWTCLERNDKVLGERRGGFPAEVHSSHLV